MNAELHLRSAKLSDVPALDRLIPVSVRALHASVYSPAQIEAALGVIFAVDRQLIRDGTYYVVEAAGGVIACGGWSRRRLEFGGDSRRGDGEDDGLDPKRHPGRIRAFFVHPSWARRGIGRELVRVSEEAMRLAAFTESTLVATIAGEPLYASQGYRVTAREALPLDGGLSLPVIRMTKRLLP